VSFMMVDYQSFVLHVSILKVRSTSCSLCRFLSPSFPSNANVRSLRTTIDSLERERSSLSNRVSSLEMQVVNAPSQDVVDKMRHELRILKRLEYNAVDYDHRDPEMTHPDIAGKDDDLESVLVAKLRKVEADLVRERREKNEGHKVRDELNQRLLAVQKSLDDAQELIASLENDLQVAVATPTSFPSTPVKGQSGDMPYGSANPPDPNTLQRILDPKAPPVLPQDIGNATATSAASPSEKAQDDHSVATIIMAQRDRLRSRCDALEAERDSFKRELQVQVQASEGLKTDNSKLYEKVRRYHTLPHTFFVHRNPQIFLFQLIFVGALPTKFQRRRVFQRGEWRLWRCLRAWSGFWRFGLGGIGGIGTEVRSVC
jgi:hypothetical protein